MNYVNVCFTPVNNKKKMLLNDEKCYFCYQCGKCLLESVSKLEDFQYDQIKKHVFCDSLCYFKNQTKTETGYHPMTANEIKKHYYLLHYVHYRFWKPIHWLDHLHHNVVSMELDKELPSDPDILIVLSPSECKLYEPKSSIVPKYCSDEYSTISEIIPGRLYLTNIHSACNIELIEHFGIQAVVNCTPYEYKPLTPHFLHLPFRDELDENLIPHVQKAVPWIEQQMTDCKPVLVHCRAGVSRSASIVIAYLMSAKGWSFNHALLHVASKRSIIDPNDTFKKQLQELQIKN